jgi:hypothetical protein
MPRTVPHIPLSYLATVDSSLRKEEWSIEEEQRMIDLHNKIGNKWAVIGSTIGTRYLPPNA